MMQHGQGAQAYTQTQVSTTTNQQQLIVMAYDGVLRFLLQAKEHIANGDIEARHDSLVRARAVIEELASTLNMEDGGEIAENLWNLYAFFMRSISEANLTGAAQPIDDIYPAVKELRDAWAEMEVPQNDPRAQALNRRVPPPADNHRVSITG